jgi:hypothetical protein
MHRLDALMPLRNLTKTSQSQRAQRFFASSASASRNKIPRQPADSFMLSE